MRLINNVRGFVTLLLVLIAISFSNCSNVDKSDNLLATTDSTQSINSFSASQQNQQQAALKFYISQINAKHLNVLQGRVVILSVEVHALNGSWMTISNYAGEGKTFDFMAGDTKTYPVETYSILPGVYDDLRVRFFDGKSQFFIQSEKISSWHKMYVKDRRHEYADDDDDDDSPAQSYAIAGNTLTSVELALDLRRSGHHKGEMGFDHSKGDHKHRSHKFNKDRKENDYLVRAKVKPISVKVSDLPAASNWVIQTSPTSNALLGLSDSAAEKVSVGALGTIISSTDGKNWLQEASPSSVNQNSIAYDGSKYIAVGDNGAIAISSSFGGTNQRSWVALRGSFGTGNLNGIACMGASCVVVGDGGQMLFSRDGQNWTLGRPVTTSNLHAVIWDGQFFVAAGDNNTLLYSADGMAWSVSNAPRGANNLIGLTSINSSRGAVVVAVGTNGTILLSNDGGVTFASVVSNTVGNLNAVSYDGKRFISVGDAGLITISVDGVTWSQEKSVTAKNLKDVSGSTDVNGAYHDVIIGDAGTILTSR